MNTNIDVVVKTSSIGRIYTALENQFQSRPGYTPRSNRAAGEDV